MANKTAATIKLIQILSAKGDYTSTSELAEIIETNPRNIKEYIKEIETCGYTVDSVAGIYGGYRINRTSLLPSMNLDKDEIKLLQASSSFINESDFENKKDYLNIIGKIISSIDDTKPITPLTMLDRFPLSMSKEELQKRYNILNEAIDGQLKVEIDYLSVMNKVKKHIIHPYKLFVYNGNWFVIAYNETVNDIGYFKLNRIDKYYITRNRFSILKTYNEVDYLDGFGMVKNGDYYHIKLELTNLNTVIKERIYGKNQKIEEIDDKHAIFSCDMQNQEMILTFVLSLGHKCKVLEPSWLKDRVKETLLKEIELYD